MRFIDRNISTAEYEALRNFSLGRPFDIIRVFWEREFIRYIVGGGVNTVLTFVVYWLLLLIVSYPIAYTVSYVAGIFSAYFINARYVFYQPLKWSKALQFPLIYIVQFAINFGMTWLLVEKLNMDAAIAPLLVTFVTIPVTFLATRLLLKPRSHPEAAAS